MIKQQQMPLSSSVETFDFLLCLKWRLLLVASVVLLEKPNYKFYQIYKHIYIHTHRLKFGNVF